MTLSEIYRLEKDKKTGKAYAPPERYLGANIGQYDQGYMVDSSRRDSNTSTRNSRRHYRAEE
eukprot:scaffold9735_cov27-Attheya_sp.AAC.2